jgi:hypothetical protein
MMIVHQRRTLDEGDFIHAWRINLIISFASKDVKGGFGESVNVLASDLIENSCTSIQQWLFEWSTRAENRTRIQNTVTQSRCSERNVRKVRCKKLPEYEKPCELRDRYSAEFG